MPRKSTQFEILVPSMKLGDFDYLEGLDLYDRALAALPYKDKTMLHHRGIWICNSGNDPNLGSEYAAVPDSTRAEADEHIYTSLAANEIDALEGGLVKTEEASERVRGYLRQGTIGLRKDKNFDDVRRQIL
jgi:hypothetical protein